MISFIKKIIFLLIIILAVLAGSFFYFRHQTYTSKGMCGCAKIFKIEKGEKTSVIAERLESEGLISWKYYFLYYLKANKLEGKILPGEYELRSEMNIPETVIMITQEQNKFVKITFPEGWDNKKIAERLSNNGFSGKEFLEISKNPSRELTNRFSFFGLLSNDASLEGYVFPDTYFFSQKLTTEEVVGKMLSNFDNRLTLEFREEIKNQGKTLNEIITMASIIEREVRSDEDRKVVSGLFWDRIKNGQPLQSCATIAYVLGENKDQYSFEDTRIESPYNTYLNAGLPPGPICNPGISSIEAAIYPKYTDYNYFLSDPKTGKTVFSRTIEEHNANKYKYGL